MSTISLFKVFAAAMTNYIEKHNANYTTIESTINQLLSLVTGQVSGSWQVPDGLKQIFDRLGIIGIDSYDFTEGALSSPNYNLVVSAGAYWDGGNFYSKSSTTTISLAGKSAGTWYLNLDTAGIPIVESSPGARPVRQFSWSGSTVSAKALYSTCAILFDGDDYADCLDSTARAKDFTSLAERLEEIEVLLGKNVQDKTCADDVYINFALGGSARITLDRATTTLHLSGAYDHQKLILEIIQDDTGGREIDFGAEVVPGIDFTFPIPLSSDPNMRDFIGLVYSADSEKYHYTSLARGY
jgi:hypothetical protein